MSDTDTGAVVDPSNLDQLRAWGGDEGAYWAAHADHFDRSMAAYRLPFLDAAAIEPDERVLDVGCGTGQTTRDAARAATAGTALGVDLSSLMIEHAVRRAAEEQLGNVRFVQADAQVHPFEAGSFDVAIGRTSAMFFGDPVAAFTNVGRALRSGGRLVLLTWQGPEPNEWIREISGALSAGRNLPLPPPGTQGPFALSEPMCVTEWLEAAGYSEIDLSPSRELMWFGEDVRDALQFIVGLMGWMLEGLDPAGRSRALEDLEHRLASHRSSDGVRFESATWTIRATHR
jgi:SAM-dependent methyltransferase